MTTGSKPKTGCVQVEVFFFGAVERAYSLVSTTLTFRLLTHR
jgi:hypothetical protein